MSHRIDLNDLPLYSSWIKSLLGLESSVRRVKTVKEVKREFDEDKWGNLLKELNRIDGPTVSDANRLFIGENEVVYSKDEYLFLGNALDVNKEYVELIRNEIMPFADSAKSLTELGAGYGNIILSLASQEPFNKVRLNALDLTETGVNCLRLLADLMDIDLHANTCDFAHLKLNISDIPENSVFMTCWSMAYLRRITDTTLDGIIYHRPRVVIHFEPIYDHFDEKTLLGLMRKRYLEINNYNRDLLMKLKDFEKKGKIEIIDEKKAIFGQNPLAPISVVKWIAV